MDNINNKLEVARLFSEIHRTLKDNMRKNCESLGLTIPQSLVIGTLIECGAMKLSELSRKISLSNSTISGIVDRLEKQQVVRRTRSEKDRRIVYVEVSPKFEETFKGVHKQAEESFADLLNSGTPEEFEKIFAGLSVLKKILSYKN